MPRTAWLSLSAVITYVLYPTVYEPLIFPGYVQTVALAAKEVFIGVVIGLTCRLAFSVLEVIGRLAQQATFPTAASSGDETLSKLYTMVGIGALFLIGGHHTFLLGLSGTLKCLPLQMLPDAGISAPQGMLRLLGTVMAAATSAALPVFAAAMISDLTVSSVSKFLSAPITSAADALRGAAASLAIALSFAAVMRVSLELFTSALDKLRWCP